MFIEDKAVGEAPVVKPTLRPLSALIREGQKMIGECHLHFICQCGERTSGCALGMAAVALGGYSHAIAVIRDLQHKGYDPFTLNWVNSEHVRGISALHIADWLAGKGQ